MAASAKDVGATGTERRQMQPVAAMHGMTNKVVHAAHQSRRALKEELLRKGHACNHSLDPKFQEFSLSLSISQGGPKKKGS